MKASRFTGCALLWIAVCFMVVAVMTPAPRAFVLVVIGAVMGIVAIALLCRGGGPDHE